MTKKIPHSYLEEREAIKPPEDIEIWEHGERYCALPKDSAIKGNWVFSKVPALKIIFEWLRDKPTYEIDICKGSQSGVTQAMAVSVSYFIKYYGYPCMHILADEDTAEYVAYDRYWHMFESHKVFTSIKNSQKWKTTEMHFMNGAYLETSWASSVSKLGARAVAICVGDEVDKPGWYKVTKEGAAIKRLNARAKTFDDLGLAKIPRLSTPTDPSGNITQGVEQCGAAVWDHRCECPHCGQFQPMNFWRDPKKNYWFPDGIYLGEDGEMHNLGRVVWDGSINATSKQIRDTVRYECGECGMFWTEQERRTAVENGKAIPRGKNVTGDERHKGIVLPDLTSNMTSMFSVVENFCGIFKLTDRIKRDEAYQFFVNEILAEPHKKVLIETTELAIFKACVPDLPQQTLPEGTVALTCGIDPGGHIFHATVWAWLPDYTSYMIHCDKMTSWDQVAEFLFGSTYGGLSIWRAGIDTGGTKVETSEMSMYEEAVRFICSNRTGKNGCKVWGTKGSSQPMGQKVKLGNRLEKFSNGKPIPGGIQLVMIDTDKMKDLFFGVRLANAINREGEERAYLHAMSPDHEMHQLFAYHLTGEQKERDPRKGTEVWVEKHANHFLDCSILAHSAADMQWPGGGVHRLGGAVGKQQQAKSVIREQQSGRVTVGPSNHPALRGRMPGEYGRRMV